MYEIDTVRVVINILASIVWREMMSSVLELQFHLLMAFKCELLRGSCPSFVINIGDCHISSIFGKCSSDTW